MKLARMIDVKFQEAVQILMKQPLPIKTAHKLRGIIRKIDEELNKYEDVRKDILGKHGVKNANGTLALKNGVVQFEGDSMKDFLKDINELTAIDVELPIVPIGDLGDNIILSAEQLMLLDGLLVD